MDKMHKSSDGKWRKCKADTKPCGVPGGHVEARDMSLAVSAMNSMGFQGGELSNMKPEDINGLAETTKRKRADTPAFILSKVENSYLPPVGLILDLEPGFVNNKRGAGPNIKNLMEERKIKASIESNRFFTIRDGVDTDMVNVTLDFQTTNPETGVTKKVSYNTDRVLRNGVPEVSLLMKNFFSDVKDGEAAAADPRLLAGTLTGRMAIKSSKTRITRGESSRKLLVDLFGEEDYKKLASDF